MSRCPGCDYPLPDNREALGARCPNCHDPLYEPAGRFGRPVHIGETPCAVHAVNESLGPCMRCGLPTCEICRCAWQRQLICTRCVEKAFESGEGPVAPQREQSRQAWLSLLFGVLAWALGGTGVWLSSVVGTTTGPLALLLLFVTCGLLLVAGALALCALGQSTAALLVRGDHTLLAGVGLSLGGLYIGLMLGVLGVGAALPT
jgi:hypothetical protein